MVKYFPIKQLRLDDRFRFHLGELPKNLIRSVSREGVLLPLIAVGEESPVLVDGYRRCALLSDSDVVAVRLLQDERTALLAAVELNMLGSAYSEMEKARLIAVVHENAWMTDREILDILLPRLGFKGGQSVLDACILVAELLQPSLFSVLAARKAPLKFALRLTGEAPDEQQVLANFFSCQRFSLSQMIQAVDLLVPVRKLGKRTFSAIIDELPREEGNALALLRQLRFPKATEIRIRLNSLLAPYRGKLSFPEDMEGDAFQFSCSIKNAKQALDCGRLLQEISEDAGLFQFLKGHVCDD
ncbi:MAG: hypothetical protein DRJ14_02465 [Acidobacteria bacterium]|nr:MAG: hypothetical protein DRJ14_02465 [Acidobacteriota bacterium]